MVVIMRISCFVTVEFLRERSRVSASRGASSGVEVVQAGVVVREEEEELLVLSMTMYSIAVSLAFWGK